MSADVENAIVLADDASLEGWQGRDESAERCVGAMPNGEDELTVGAGRHTDVLDAGQATELALERSDARYADEPDDHDLRGLAAGRLGGVSDALGIMLRAIRPAGIEVGKCDVGAHDLLAAGT